MIWDSEAHVWKSFSRWRCLSATKLWPFPCTPSGKIGSTNRSTKKGREEKKKIKHLVNDAPLSRRFYLLLRSYLIQKLNRPCINQSSLTWHEWKPTDDSNHLISNRIHLKYLLHLICLTWGKLTSFSSISLPSNNLECRGAVNSLSIQMHNEDGHVALQVGESSQGWQWAQKWHMAGISLPPMGLPSERQPRSRITDKN